MWPDFGRWPFWLAAGALVAIAATSCSSGTDNAPPGAVKSAPPTSRPALSVVQAQAPASWLMGHDWERIPTTRHVVALTFDAGSNAVGVRSILDTLAAQRVRASFFLTGNWVRAYPIRAWRIADSHLIANHSMTHPAFTGLTATQIRSQLARAAAAMQNVCARSPAPLFRFPFGDRDARTVSVVNNSGYVAVRWTVDTLGWKGTGDGMSVGSVVRRVLANIRPGEIVLMHVGANPDDHSTLDASALPRIISALRSRGYSFVTLNALLSARS
jgi:peptidoglycan/xylan/chitin deacetylase (PgdA/CDA1 family)